MRYPLRIFPTAGVRQMLFDQFPEPEWLVEFAHQDQAAVGLPPRGPRRIVHSEAVGRFGRRVGSDAGTLEIDLERGVEGELKGLVLYLTHWALTSGASSSRSHPHEY